MKRATLYFLVSIAPAALSGPAAAEGDAAAGKEAFDANCWGCHSVEQGGPDKVGPNLFGLFGATAAKRAASFESRHSEELKASGIVWSEETLDEWLAGPDKMVPFTFMPFPGFPEKTDRDNVIAYLKSVTQ